MKPGQMTTVELMKRVAIGDASEMAAELVARAEKIEWLIKYHEYDDTIRMVLNHLNDPWL